MVDRAAGRIKLVGAVVSVTTTKEVAGTRRKSEVVSGMAGDEDGIKADGEKPADAMWDRDKDEARDAVGEVVSVNGRRVGSKELKDEEKGSSTSSELLAMRLESCCSMELTADGKADGAVRVGDGILDIGGISELED